MDLTDRVAVVTGGASGIGAAVVARLTAAGARPVVWDLAPAGPGAPPNAEVVMARSDGLADGAGATVPAITCDVSDPASVGRALDATIEHTGAPPSLLVTAAGIGGFSPVVEMDLVEWQRVIDVNLTGTMLCLRSVGAALVAAGGAAAGFDGAMVAVSSINGRISDRGMAAYCCSKAGVDMLVRVAAAELGPSGIRVNAVAPGVTDTPLFSGSAGLVPGFVDALAARTALGRIGTADEVAGAVVALLATDWVTGQSLVADGGLTLHSPLNAWGAASGST